MGTRRHWSETLERDIGACGNMTKDMTREVDVSSLELMDYTYVELCDALGEKTRTGNSKMSQMKRWKRYFSYDRLTSRVFRVSKIYDEPMEVEDGRRGNGGSRTGSGNRCSIGEEFGHLINAFLHKKFNVNSYRGEARLCSAYFTNKEIGLYFGLFNDDFYGAVDDYRNRMIASGVSGDELTILVGAYKRMWRDVGRKISERRRSWVYDRVDRMDGLTLCDGIRAWVSDEEFEYRDDLLDDWKTYQRRYMLKNDFKNEGDVAESDRWGEMIAEVSRHFDRYERVSKVRKIEFDVEFLKPYDADDIDVWRRRFNDKMCDSLIGYFGKRRDEGEMEMVTDVIDRFVRIRRIDG